MRKEEQELKQKEIAEGTRALWNNVYNGIQEKLRAVQDATQVMEFVSNNWHVIFEGNSTNAKKYADVVGETVERHQLFLHYSTEVAEILDGALGDKGFLVYLEKDLAETAKKFWDARRAAGESISGQVAQKSADGQTNERELLRAAEHLHNIFAASTNVVRASAEDGERLCLSLMDHIRQFVPDEEMRILLASFLPESEREGDVLRPVEGMIHYIDQGMKEEKEVMMRAGTNLRAFQQCHFNNI